MRLVFVLYAEDRDLMSSDPVYSNNYSITGLFERLREDDGPLPRHDGQPLRGLVPIAHAVSPGV